MTETTHFCNELDDHFVPHRIEGGLYIRQYDRHKGVYRVPALVGHDVNRKLGSVHVTVKDGALYTGWAEWGRVACDMTASEMRGRGKGWDGPAVDIAEDVTVPAAAIAWLQQHAGLTSGKRPRCPDCGEPNERRGHQACQYPQDA